MEGPIHAVSEIKRAYKKVVIFKIISQFKALQTFKYAQSLKTFMSIITKLTLRIIAGISFLLAMVSAYFGAQRSMMAYGPPEMMNQPDPFGAGKLMVASLLLLVFSILLSIASFFKKD